MTISNLGFMLGCSSNGSALRGGASTKLRSISVSGRIEAEVNSDPDFAVPLARFDIGRSVETQIGAAREPLQPDFAEKVRAVHRIAWLRRST